MESSKTIEILSSVGSADVGKLSVDPLILTKSVVPPPIESPTVSPVPTKKMAPANANGISNGHASPSDNHITENGHSSPSSNCLLQNGQSPTSSRYATPIGNISPSSNYGTPNGHPSPSRNSPMPNGPSSPSNVNNNNDPLHKSSVLNELLSLSNSNGTHRELVPKSDISNAIANGLEFPAITNEAPADTSLPWNVSKILAELPIELKPLPQSVGLSEVNETFSSRLASFDINDNLTNKTANLGVRASNTNGIQSVNGSSADFNAASIVKPYTYPNASTPESHSFPSWNSLISDNHPAITSSSQRPTLFNNQPEFISPIKDFPTPKATQRAITKAPAYQLFGGSFPVDSFLPSVFPNYNDPRPSDYDNYFINGPSGDFVFRDGSITPERDNGQTACYSALSHGRCMWHDVPSVRCPHSHGSPGLADR